MGGAKWERIKSKGATFSIQIIISAIMNPKQGKSILLDYVQLGE